MLQPLSWTTYHWGMVYTDFEIEHDCCHCLTHQTVLLVEPCNKHQRGQYSIRLQILAVLYMCGFAALIFSCLAHIFCWKVFEKY